jgi:hypothetical protein
VIGQESGNSSAAPETDSPHPATLRGLLDVLGEPVLSLVAAPHGLDTSVSMMIIHEPRATAAFAGGALLLAVGLRPESSDTAAIVRKAAVNGLAGVVIKKYGESVTDLADIAQAEGVALLLADDDLPWHRATLLIAAALGRTARSEDAAAGPAIGDLFALANAIAAMVGGATAIEDPRQRILAYSTLPGQPIDEERRQGILDLKVPTTPLISPQYRVLAHTDAVCRFGSDMDSSPRLAVAVRAGDELLGSIWVIDAEGTLGAEAEQALTEAAGIAALHLLRARTADDLARRQRGDVLRRLLDDQGAVELIAPQLGLGVEAAVAVVAFVIATDSPDGARTAHALLQLTDLVGLQCETHYGRHGCALIDRTVYALLPAGVSQQAHHQLVADIVRRAEQSLRVPVHAGLGRVVTGLRAAPLSRRDADLVLQVLARRPDRDKPQLADIDDVRASVALIELGEAVARTDRVRDGVGPAVRAHDAAHGTRYATTLLTYLESDGDIATTARRLNVHPNTCRYRLARAEKAFGFRLDEPDERLLLWLQLRLARGSSGEAAGS